MHQEDLLHLVRYGCLSCYLEGRTNSCYRYLAIAARFSIGLLLKRWRPVAMWMLMREGYGLFMVRITNGFHYTFAQTLFRYPYFQFQYLLLPKIRNNLEMAVVFDSFMSRHRLCPLLCVTVVCSYFWSSWSWCVETKRPSSPRTILCRACVKLGCSDQGRL